MSQGAGVLPPATYISHLELEFHEAAAHDLVATALLCDMMNNYHHSVQNQGAQNPVSCYLTNRQSARDSGGQCPRQMSNRLHLQLALCISRCRGWYEGIRS